MTYRGAMNASVFVDFLSRLMEGSEQPVYLIVDGHPVRRSKAVKEFVEAHREKLELYLFPSILLPRDQPG
jgi:transposase